MAVLSALSNHSPSLACGKDNTTPPHANPLAFDSCILCALCVVGEVFSGIRILLAASKSMGDARRRDRRAAIPLQPVEISVNSHWLRIPRHRHSHIWL